MTKIKNLKWIRSSLLAVGIIAAVSLMLFCFAFADETNSNPEEQQTAQEIQQGIVAQNNDAQAQTGAASNDVVSITFACGGYVYPDEGVDPYTMQVDGEETGSDYTIIDMNHYSAISYTAGFEGPEGQKKFVVTYKFKDASDTDTEIKVWSNNEQLWNVSKITSLYPWNSEAHPANVDIPIYVEDEQQKGTFFVTQLYDPDLEEFGFNNQVYTEFVSKKASVEVRLSDTGKKYNCFNEAYFDSFTYEELSSDLTQYDKAIFNIPLGSSVDTYLEGDEFIFPPVDEQSMANGKDKLETDEFNFINLARLMLPGDTLNTNNKRVDVCSFDVKEALKINQSYIKSFNFYYKDGDELIEIDPESQEFDWEYYGYHRTYKISYSEMVIVANYEEPDLTYNEFDYQICTPGFDWVDGREQHHNPGKVFLTGVHDKFAIDENLSIPEYVYDEEGNDYIVIGLGNTDWKRIGIGDKIKELYIPLTCYLLFDRALLDCENLEKVTFGEWPELPEVIEGLENIDKAVVFITDYTQDEVKSEVFPKHFIVNTPNGPEWEDGYATDVDNAVVNKDPEYAYFTFEVCRGTYVKDDFIESRQFDEYYILESVVEGRVLDENKNPLPGAKVTLIYTDKYGQEMPRSFSAYTDDNGNYRLYTPSGNVGNYTEEGIEYYGNKIKVEKDGYTQAVNPSANIMLAYTSKPQILKDGYLHDGYHINFNWTPQLTWNSTRVVIQSVCNLNYVVDVMGCSKDNRANVQIYEYNGTPAQIFDIEKVSDLGNDGSLVKIKNVNSGKYIDVQNCQAFNYSNVQQWEANDTLAQRWIMKDNGYGTVKFLSAINTKYALDLDSCRAVNYNNIQLYEDNGTDAQRFIVTKTDPNVAGSPYSPFPYWQGVFSINQSDNVNMAVSLEEHSDADCVNVCLKNFNKYDEANYWFFNCVDRDNGFYTIQNVYSGKYLDVSGENILSGTNILQYQGNKQGNQLWKIEAYVDANFGVGYRLVNVGTGLYLDNSGCSCTDGNNIQGFIGNGSSAQSWILNLKDEELAEQKLGL